MTKHKWKAAAQKPLPDLSDLGKVLRPFKYQPKIRFYGCSFKEIKERLIKLLERFNNND